MVKRSPLPKAAPDDDPSQILVGGQQIALGDCSTQDLKDYVFKLSGTRLALAKAELERRGWGLPFIELPADWKVVEGVSGTFFYHLRNGAQPNPLSQPAVCGARVMTTEIPLSAWGFVGHLKERWCAKCAAHSTAVFPGKPV